MVISAVMVQVPAPMRGVPRFETQHLYSWTVTPIVSGSVEGSCQSSGDGEGKRGRGPGLAIGHAGSAGHSQGRTLKESTSRSSARARSRVRVWDYSCGGGPGCGAAFPCAGVTLHGHCRAVGLAEGQDFGRCCPKVEAMEPRITVGKERVERDDGVAVAHVDDAHQRSHQAAAGGCEEGLPHRLDGHILGVDQVERVEGGEEGGAIAVELESGGDGELDLGRGESCRLDETGGALIARLALTNGHT